MKNKILKFIKNNKEKKIDLTLIATRFKNFNKNSIEKAVSSLINEGLIVKKNNFFFTPEEIKTFNVEIIKDCGKFLIAEKLKDSSRILIDKKFSKGALKGDFALIFKARFNKNNKTILEEGRIKKIIKPTSSSFTGTIIKKNNQLMLKPDEISKSYFQIKKEDKKNLKCYDKVVAKIFKRNEDSEKNIVSITANFKTSNKAINCANAIIASQGVEFNFSEDVLKSAKELEKNKKHFSLKNRVDLTKEIIFTIDGETAKDLDDAVSIKKLKDHYLLGVHIADVSHYVEKDGLIDKEALKRGNSIYYANKVIPMLPEVLCNNLCSLNPNEKKLTFSVLLKLDFNGKLLSFEFFKSVISSKVKGVYEEINELIEKGKKCTYFKKYEKILPNLKIMLELYEILKQNKIKRGSPEILTKESSISLNEKDEVVKVEEKKQGKTQEMIEEFMILANTAAATLAKKKNLPFIFRVHKPPKSEKINNLIELFKKLHIPHGALKVGVHPKVLASVLKKHENSEFFSLLNISILRNMEKAEYQTKPLGHFGLVLKNYSHFTSPIRRYPDLLIHRILTEHLVNKTKINNITKKYSKIAKKAAKSSSKCERKAITIERACSNCFKAEFMKTKIGQTFEGVISSIISSGFFVMLENTIEGFVSIKELPQSFEFCDNFYFFSKKLNKSFKIGQKLKVTCFNVNISLGKIDFKLFKEN